VEILTCAYTRELRDLNECEGRIANAGQQEWNRAIINGTTKAYIGNIGVEARTHTSALMLHVLGRSGQPNDQDIRCYSSELYFISV
jgi:hypothetical protein